LGGCQKKASTKKKGEKEKVDRGSVDIKEERDGRGKNKGEMPEGESQTDR